MQRHQCRVASLVLYVLLAAGCGSNNPENAPAAGTGSPPEADETVSTTRTEITADDLVAYERGIRRESAAVRAAQQAAAAATDAQERGRAMQAQWDTATIPLGAEASGLRENRYRAVRLVVHDLLRDLDFKGEIDGPMSIDLERADAATKARLARDAYADLDPASAAALRAAIPRLTPAWVEYVKLTAVAG
jgi:hypothetical protein